MTAQRGWRTGAVALILGLLLGVGCDSGAERSEAADAARTDATATLDASRVAVDLGPALDAGDAAMPGPAPVGVTRREVRAPGDRALTVEIWYPSVPHAGDGEALLDLATPGQRDALASRLADAPPGCPTERTTAKRDAAPAEGRWPVLVFSHCFACLRFSSVTLAETLAAAGFVVAAPDHAGGTLADPDPPLNAEFLQIRADDLRAVLDALSALPPADALADHVDVSRIGAVGHSYGSVSVGLLAQTDARVAAVAGLAAPMENPLLPGVRVAELTQPLLFLVAGEDNSISEIGNRLLRQNFTAATSPAWKVEIADAGHWTVSDLVGVPGFEPGCGEGRRQTNGQPFQYLDPAQGRALSAERTKAFFLTTLGQGGPTAAAELERDDSRNGIAVERK